MKKLIVAFLMLAWAMTAAHAPMVHSAEDRETLRDRIRERRAAQPNRSTRNASMSRPGNHTRKLVHGGLTREYLVHVPKGYDSSRPAPLVIALHGGGGNMEIQANDTYYGLISKSDQSAAIVAFPNGYSRRRSGNLATWNAGECCGPAQQQNIDDVGFIRAMLAELRKDLDIDPKRIYATGMSNGGLMAYRLACEMSDVFRAIAAVAGTDNTIECKPKNAVSVLHIHAQDDTHVLFEGGKGPDAIKGAVSEFKSVRGTIAKWVRLNACASNPKRILERPGAYCEVNAPCSDDVEIQLCVTEDGGHSWPGGQKPRGTGTPSRALSATETIWEFFERVSK